MKDLSKSIAVREEAPSSQSTQNRDRRLRGRLLLGEIAAPHNRDSQDLEIFRRDIVECGADGWTILPAGGHARQCTVEWNGGSGRNRVDRGIRSKSLHHAIPAVLDNLNRDHVVGSETNIESAHRHGR